MTFRQKCQRQTLLSAKAKALYEMYTSYEAYYSYYLKVLDEFEGGLDDLPYPQRERLLQLASKYHQCDEAYKKTIRSIFNFDRIVKDEDEDYVRIVINKNASNRVVTDFKKRQLGRLYNE